MELKEYLRIFKKHFKLIIATTILLTLAAFIFTLTQPISYQATGSLTIVPKSIAELKNVYQYDGYYSLQTSNLFGVTITSWLGNPDIVTEIFQKAGYTTEGISVQALSKFINTSQMLNSSSVTFRLGDRDENKTQKLATATIEVVRNKTVEFNQAAGTRVNFEIVATSPLVNKVEPKKELNTAVGFLSGLILGVFLSFVLEYLKK